MASIFAKKGTLFLGYYIVDNFGKKKHVQKSLKMNDTRANRKLANLIKREKELELMKPDEPLLKYNLDLKTSFKLFLASKKNTAIKTRYNYNRMFIHFTKVVSSKAIIKDITRRNIQEFEEYLRIELKMAPNSVASYFKDLNTFWNWMIKEKLATEKVTWRIKQEVKPITTISDEDFEIILNYLYSNNIEQYRFIKFLKLTGFRISEAINIKWEDIDYINDRILLNNKKAKREDEFPLYYALKEFLHSFKKDKGKIFIYKSTENLRFWRRTMNKLKMKYTLHTIRKTFATRLVNKNVSVFDAMKLLRHKNVGTTMKYYTYADLKRLGNEANKVFGDEEMNKIQNHGIENYSSNLKVVFKK